MLIANHEVQNNCLHNRMNEHSAILAIMNRISEFTKINQALSQKLSFWWPMCNLPIPTTNKYIIGLSNFPRMNFIILNPKSCQIVELTNQINT